MSVPEKDKPTSEESSSSSSCGVRSSLADRATKIPIFIGASDPIGSTPTEMPKKSSIVIGGANPASTGDENPQTQTGWNGIFGYWGWGGDNKANPPSAASSPPPPPPPPAATATRLLNLFKHGDDAINSADTAAKAISAREPEAPSQTTALAGTGRRLEDSSTGSAKIFNESKPKQEARHHAGEQPLNSSDAKKVGEAGNLESSDESEEMTIAKSSSAPPESEKSKEHDETLENDATDKLSRVAIKGGKRADSERASHHEGEDNEVTSEVSNGGTTDGPYKIVVKEAPLLRLDDVTSMTRSNIPESKMTRHRSSCKQAWCLFNWGKREERHLFRKYRLPVLAELKSKSQRNLTDLDADYPSGSDESAQDAAQRGQAITNLPPGKVGHGDTDVIASESGQLSSVAPKKSDRSMSPLRDGAVAGSASDQKVDAALEAVGNENKSKEKKIGLSPHLRTTIVQKFNSYGDEVSVGTMDLKEKKVERQLFSLPKNLYVEDELTTGKASRPWESSLKRRKKVTPKSPELGIQNSIIEEAPEGDLDSTHHTTASGSELESLGKHEGSGHPEGSDEDDALQGMMSISQLETKLAEDEAKEVDFEDMWDTITADPTTVLECDHPRTGKAREQLKKEIKREKQKEEQISKTERLRLFEEREKGNDLASERNVTTEVKLSSEFLLALKTVFDDDESKASNVDESFSEDLELEVREGTLHCACSDDLTGDDDLMPRGSSKSQSESSTIRSGDDRGGHSKKEYGAKIMSISNLRQEMNDRRGTSVNLLKKEFVDLKRKKALQMAVGDSSDRLQKQTGVRGIKLCGQMQFDDFPSPDRGGRASNGAGSDQPEDYFASEADKNDRKRKEDGLGSHFSRWSTDESVTKLDDLMTVKQASVKEVNKMGMMAAGEFAGQSISLVPAVQTSHFMSEPEPGLSPSTSPGISPGLSTVGLSSDIISLGVSSLLSPLSNVMTASTFADMPLSSIQEEHGSDHGNERGLLASGSDDWGDGGGCVATASSSRDTGIGRRKLGVTRQTAKMKMPLAKAPKLGGVGGKLKKMKGLIVKGRMGGSGGVMRSTDDARCLLG